MPYSRPAGRFLIRAVNAVKQRRCGSKDRDPLPEGGRLGPWLIYIFRRHLDAAAVSDDNTAQHSPPQRQLSAGEGSSRPPATICRISLTNGAGRALLRRDVARGLRVEGVSYDSAERPFWLLACAVAVRCCLK